MADKVSIAITSERAMRRFIAATQEICEKTGVTPLGIPEKNRDRDYQNMAQLVCLADWLESLAAELPSKPVKTKGAKNDSAITS